MILTDSSLGHLAVVVVPDFVSKLQKEGGERGMTTWTEYSRVFEAGSHAGMSVSESKKGRAAECQLMVNPNPTPHAVESDGSD